MQFTSITANIHWIDFNSQYQLASSLIRFQEHYESPEFKDKVFTLGQYREWYKTTRPHGKFSYYSDWNGFNVPSYVFKPFMDGSFDPLTQGENDVLLMLMKNGVDINGNFYLVGTHGGNLDILNHEICHALYYTNSEYKEKADKLLNSYDLSDLYSKLLGMGYHKELCMDEAQAYIATGLPDGVICPSELINAMVAIKDSYLPTSL